VKVLVTGASGQLGHALVATRPAGLEVVALDRAALARACCTCPPTTCSTARTMLRLFGEGRSPTVVDDQVGTPTHAKSLARALWTAAAKEDVAGLQHYTDAGVASWYDFAVAILEEARARGLAKPEVTVTPIPSRQYPTPARRAPYGVLDKTDTWARLGGPAAHWREELRRAFTEIPA
jgi:dTDP-4-dehydrorhamnose reductase